MDSDHYAQWAMDLVNAGSGDALPISTTRELRSWLGSRPDLAERVVDADVAPVLAVQAVLRELCDDAAAGDGEAVVARLNALLAEHPIAPRISGHDGRDLHLHIRDERSTVAEALVGEALFGLMMLVVDRGATRIGRCAADNCDWAFVDTSPNHTRRFCESTCATRTNVAAHRRRRREAAARPA